MKLIGICAVLAVLAILAAWILGAEINTYISPSYEARVRVDGADKIPQALSNAVEQVKSKGFQVVELTTSKNLFKDVYTVTCKGVEPAKILEWKGSDAPAPVK